MITEQIQAIIDEFNAYHRHLLDSADELVIENAKLNIATKIQELVTNTVTDKEAIAAIIESQLRQAIVDSDGLASLATEVVANSIEHNIGSFLNGLPADKVSVPYSLMAKILTTLKDLNSRVEALENGVVREDVGVSGASDAPNASTTSTSAMDWSDLEVIEAW